MNPLIKWPGGKSGEIEQIEHLIPKYDRYIEPFFGGGALFFHLRPPRAAINDISPSLMEYYSLLKAQDQELHQLLLCYHDSFSRLLSVCDAHYGDILNIYHDLSAERLDKHSVKDAIACMSSGLFDEMDPGFRERLLLDAREFNGFLVKMAADKMVRTVANHRKKPFSDEDLKSNLLTGFTSGYYMYFRKVYNDLSLGRTAVPSLPYKAANFYFIREYCYGSMFRYNAKGEFNIPYGGISYNTKNLKTKIENMFNQDVEDIFRNTEICCSDFSDFFKTADLTERDFMFLDPPYDTDFSDYEGRAFTKSDQERLACELKKTRAKFILIIKNTEFIHGLYERDFNMLSFDNQYTYNVRSRNERSVEHLIITNLPV